MIASTIQDYQQVQGVPPQLKALIGQALSIIERQPDEGRYDIEGDAAFVLISRPLTEPQAQRPAELHHRYLDVQILLEGEEVLGYGLMQCHATPENDQLKEKDIAFFNAIPNEQFLHFQPGNFVIFFPKELHRPLCAVRDTPQKIKKAVLKVRMDFLN
ncbi:YhcH/YjgK/YiaL family protein [Pantoea sp. FN060301]|uniref:YhcH/YjgK/YiaL family protein n=1 Tax=Pantoea sp. FN060301 TaxID=3420380 RepID=UPI003D1704C8